MRMKTIWPVRALFWCAAALGLAFNLPKYFLLEQIGRQTPPPITHPEYFYGFLGLGVAWQLGFVLIGTEPFRYRPFMLAGQLEKSLVGLASTFLYMASEAVLKVFVVGLSDLLFAALFVAAWFATRGRQRPTDTAQSSTS
jgi:hypothetical protein